MSFIFYILEIFNSSTNRKNRSTTEALNRISDYLLELVWCCRPDAVKATFEGDHQYRYPGIAPVEIWQLVKKIKKLKWNKETKNWDKKPANTDINIYNQKNKRYGKRKGKQSYSIGYIPSNLEKKLPNLELSNWGNLRKTDKPDYYYEPSYSCGRPYVVDFGGTTLNAGVSRMMMTAKFLNPRFNKATQGRTSVHHIDNNVENNHQWNLGTYFYITSQLISFFIYN